MDFFIMYYNLRMWFNYKSIKLEVFNVNFSDVLIFYSYHLSALLIKNELIWNYVNQLGLLCMKLKLV
jgi:hypothetical protein